MTDLRSIVREVGGDLYANGTRATVPGPGHSRTDRSLSLRLVKTDTGVDRVLFHSFADDSPRDVIKYLGLSTTEARQATREERARWRRQREEEERRQRLADQALCQEIWRGTEPLEGSLAESYLWSRKLLVGNCTDLRFHPCAPRAKPRAANDPRPLPPPHPALVAVVRDRNGASQALHLTYVALDGRGKAFGDRSRLMFGPMRGGAVHLTPAAPEMAVGEGLESCIAYRGRTGLPVWAALTTSQYSTLELPLLVRKLVIAADGDRGGLNAAAGLAERISRRADVHIDAPPDGQDWADVWEASNV